MKYALCQSCGMPLVDAIKGTNRDKSTNNEYCMHCFQNGEFTDHHLTMHKLEVKILEMAEVHNDLTLEEARQVIKILPTLKRWQMSNL
ncbi:zinc ribbon domain-containing protein [Gillisia sp. M10.2A]|uniref:Zinc ribbon domain-containing protein n=1 Tax=Gillisia lutea TaxID=2909668 RepID=A0ABS9EMP0_9FLAO|nr:zinc ribbon domain-containing protein [Gillisia lutea]MCF4102721.1 zinc ribbon domain-containing protein [Gillisia lutea]